MVALCQDYFLCFDIHFMFTQDFNVEVKGIQNIFIVFFAFLLNLKLFQSV